MMHRRLRAGLALLLLSAGASAMAAARWQFRAAYDEARGELSVSACSEAAQPRVRFISGVDGAARHRVQAERSGAGPLEHAGDALVAAEWAADECLQTRVDLRGAVQRESHRSAARDYLMLDPRRWLWRPEELSPESTIRFTLPAQWSVSVPWAREAEAAHTYRLGAVGADWPARSAFGRFEERVFTRPGGALRVAMLPPWSAAETRRLEPVIQALEQAYGRWPRHDTQVLIVPLPGRRDAAPWGEVMRGGGAAVHLFVGADAAPNALIEDWTATHEFSHLLHPNLGARGRWLSEGLASYYQNVLRARTGVLTTDDAWARIEAGFGRGRAERKAVGLTLTQAARRMHESHGYMRVYWSGTAYWLEADLDLRARGSSLDAVLSEYGRCCLEGAVEARPEDFVASLDRIAQADVFVSRYRRYSQATEFPEVSTQRVSPEQRGAIMQPRSDVPALPQ